MPAQEALAPALLVEHAVKSARRQNHLSRGLNECARTLEQGDCELCVVWHGITIEPYSQVVQILCSQRNIPLLTVDSPQVLAEWAGQGRLVRENEGDIWRGNTNGCSIVVIRQWNVKDSIIQQMIAYIKGLQDARR